MKRWPIVLLLTALVTLSLYADDQAHMEANAILRKASDLEIFKVGEAPKFRREVQFSFLRGGKEEAKGTYVSEVDTSALWHDEIEFGKFKHQRVRIKRQIWTRQNYDFVPLQVEGLLEALEPTRSQLAESMVVKRIKNRKINDIESRCIEYESTVGKDKGDGQICVQADAGYVIYRQYHGQFVDRATTYSDFSPLGSKVRPRHLEVAFDPTEKIVADVNYLVVEKFDPVGFEPIVGGDVRDVCTATRPPFAKSAPDPKYPPNVPRGYNGKIILDLKIGPDGHVLNAAVLQSLQTDLDTDALRVVKTWEFEPGTCDGNPTTSFTRVEMTYRSGR